MKKAITLLALVTLVGSAAQAGWFESENEPVRNLRQYSFEHPNGKPKLSYSAYTVDGKEIRHGAYRDYNLNGSIRESGVYTDGAITKRTTYKWYGSGQKSREETVNLDADGRSVGRSTVHTWYLSGKPSSDWIYKNGVQIQFNSYYPEGGPKEQKRYNDSGMLHGAQQGWYESGAKSYNYNYRNDQKHGAFIQWNEGSVVVRDEVWHLDQLVLVDGKEISSSQAVTNFNTKREAEEKDPEPSRQR